MKNYILALTFFQLLILASVAQDVELRVRGNSWPGGALFVSLEGRDLVSGTYSWAGRTGKLTKAPYGLRTAVSVPLDASAGGQATLKLRIVNASGAEQELSRKVTIDNKWRPVQYLSMSSANEAKYTDPKADREEVLVFDALEDLQPGPRWRGNFIEPSSAPRSSPFGVRRIRNGRTAGFHRGLDYADWEGQPVVAPADGLVTLVGPNFTLLGNCVIINYGEGLCVLYMHLSQINVKQGQEVSKGQIVGLVGNTGASTGPHLHYATYLHGVPIDPDILLNMPKEWAPDTW